MSARLHELDGESLTIREWAERFGLPRGLVAVRVSKGWDLRVALTRQPVAHGGPRRTVHARADATRPRQPRPATTVAPEPALSVADQRIEDAIRDLRAQVVRGLA